MTNEFAYNPAVAGSYDHFLSQLSFRKQWAGLDGAPTTFAATIHGNLARSKAVGLGMILYSDVTGPTRRVGANIAYAYQIPIADKTTLGLGIAADLMQHSIMYSDLVLAQDLDPSILAGDSGKFGFDANFGVYLNGPNYWAGFSANQLMGSKFDFVGGVDNFVNARHFFATAGYELAVSERIDIIPGVLGKFVAANSPQFELNLRAEYTDNYWLGLSYRTEDALAVILGLRLDNGFNLAYSYDITTSAINTVSNGTHEITLGYNFNIFGDAEPVVSPREY